MTFYTMPEYEAWKSATDNGKGFNIKYYKGLGTSTSKEAKEYFSAIDSHRMSYRHESMEDDRTIDLAFNKKRADDRKIWINGYEEGSLVDHNVPEVSYKDFINKELVLFAKATGRPGKVSTPILRRPLPPGVGGSRLAGRCACRRLREGGLAKVPFLFDALEVIV